jgi:transposase
MAAKTISMSTLKQLVRFYKQGRSKKYISRTTGISRNTVKKYISVISEKGLSVDSLLKLDEQALELLFKHPVKPTISSRQQYFAKEVDHLIEELSQRHVTRRLLWIEYKKRDPGGYEYSQFCYHLQQAMKARQVSMMMSHDPADMLYVDFAGSTLTVYEGVDHQAVEKQVFVATLGYSQYSYVEAIDSQSSVDFISALNRCLKYYGGVPKGIVTDNLKSAVTKTDRYEPQLNRVLEDFANHYGTTIIPARVAKPKDKSLVENMVKHSYSHIYAPLRHRKFFDLQSLNETIEEQLMSYNEKNFQRRNYSRYSRFISEEKHLLNPLPEHLFQLKKYRRLRVQKNAHVLLTEDHHYYSVPYAYIGKRVKVIYTNSIVNVYFQSRLITSHARNKKAYGYSSIAEHLPSHFQDYKDRSPQFYLKWAKSLSPEVFLIIQKVLDQRKHPEQAYRICDGIKHLSYKVDPMVFQKACHIAVQYQCYQYGFIKALIENGMTNQDIDLSDGSISLPNHKNIRGRNYYQNQSL